MLCSRRQTCAVLSKRSIQCKSWFLSLILRVPLDNEFEMFKSTIVSWHKVWESFCTNRLLLLFLRVLHEITFLSCTHGQLGILHYYYYMRISSCIYFNRRKNLSYCLTKLSSTLSKFIKFWLTFSNAISPHLLINRHISSINHDCMFIFISAWIELMISRTFPFHHELILFIDPYILNFHCLIFFVYSM